MKEWTETGNGYRSKTIKRGDCTIIVHRPVLTDKESTKRERVVETALSIYGKSINK